jgi:hypothetical protein
LLIEETFLHYPKKVFPFSSLEKCFLLCSGTFSMLGYAIFPPKELTRKFKEVSTLRRGTKILGKHIPGMQKELDR